MSNISESPGEVKIGEKKVRKIGKRKNRGRERKKGKRGKIGKKEKNVDY